MFSRTRHEPRRKNSAGLISLETEKAAAFVSTDISAPLIPALNIFCWKNQEEKMPSIVIMYELNFGSLSESN
jgi:hypothetical protein